MCRKIYNSLLIGAVIIGSLFTLFFVSLNTCKEKFAVAMAAESKLEIKTPSKYRKINDKTSDAYWKDSIEGIGIGNAIFSSKNLSLGEDKYEDIRDTFYYQKDTSIYCCLYLPGTLRSIVNVFKSKVKGAEFIDLLCQLSVLRWVTSDYWKTSGWDLLVDPAWMHLGKYFDKIADYDKHFYPLLPYKEGGVGQLFKQIDLSKILDKSKPGTYKVKILIWCRFQTGKKWVSRTEGNETVTTEEPITNDYPISYGEFSYIKE